MTLSKIGFWQSHLDWFIPFVSEFYPLNKLQLLKYEELWDWDRIKSNPFIKWDKQTLICFKETLDSAKAINYLQLDVYYGKSAIPEYPSAEKVYLRDEEKSKGKIYWKEIQFGIKDIGLAGEDDVVMKLIWHFRCSKRLNFYLFKNRPLGSEYLEKITESNDWKLLSRYFGLDWSIELLKQFEEFWHTNQLTCNHAVFNNCLKDDLNDDFIDAVLS